MRLPQLIAPVWFTGYWLFGWFTAHPALRSFAFTLRGYIRRCARCSLVTFTLRGRAPVYVNPSYAPLQLDHTLLRTRTHTRYGCSYARTFAVALHLLRAPHRFTARFTGLFPRVLRWLVGLLRVYTLDYTPRCVLLRLRLTGLPHVYVYAHGCCRLRSTVAFYTAAPDYGRCARADCRWTRTPFTFVRTLRYAHLPYTRFGSGFYFTLRRTLDYVADVLPDYARWAGLRLRRLDYRLRGWLRCTRGCYVGYTHFDFTAHV